MDRITIHIASRDRHSELSLLLQSLRTQTYQDFDILILDDGSGIPVQNCYFLSLLTNRLRLEGHKIKIIRNDKSFGVCYARNYIIENDDFNNPLTARLDDDVILQPDYLERLAKVIDVGYDIASGITPLLGMPEVKRETKFVKPIINEHKFDKEGNLIKWNDDCGYCYLEDEIIPTHQFRSSAIIKSEIYKKVMYEKNLTKVGFREEGFFSFKAILNNYKIGVDTQAVIFHQVTPSGGVRNTDYTNCVNVDNNTFKEWCKKMYKERGDFLEEYNRKVVK